MARRRWYPLKGGSSPEPRDLTLIGDRELAPGVRDLLVAVQKLRLLFDQLEDNFFEEESSSLYQDGIILGDHGELQALPASRGSSAAGGRPGEPDNMEITREFVYDKRFSNILLDVATICP